MLELTLATVKDGALEEMFQDEMRKVVRDIQNPNTDPVGKRTINITLSLQPMKGNREMCSVVISCGSKLGKGAPLECFVSMGYDPISGEIAANEYRPKQQDMWDVRSVDKLVIADDVSSQ